MISKLRISLVAVIMLVLLGFGFQNQAKGQVDSRALPFDLSILETGGSICPIVPHTTGYLEFSGLTLGIGERSFSAGLLGTVEVSGLDSVAGLDWMQQDPDDYEGLESVLGTTLTGSQIVSWWDQNEGRNTYIQVTNTHPRINIGGTVPPIEQRLSVHVVVLGENCLEVVNFCDTYSGFDTHEYDFRDFTSNQGQDIPDLTDGEGFVVITAVDNCELEDNHVIGWNYLAGQMTIHDPDDYLYGANTYARQAECECDYMSGDEVNTVCEEDYGCELFDVIPDNLFAEFNVLPGNITAGSDLVFINFSDLYHGLDGNDGYTVLPEIQVLQTDIYDENEAKLSCPDKIVCYARFGIDEPIVISEEFVPPTPTPSPSPTPSPTPTPSTPSPTPTPPTPSPTPNRNNSSSSCAIAGNPVQLGTALANVLIPLVPVAFAFGVRAVRRRKK